MAKKDILDLIKNKDLTLKEKISRLPQGWTRDFTMNELLTEIPKEYKKAYIDINNAYWKDRNIINYINGEKNALRASNNLEKVYKESVQNIEDKIDVFYGRYANKEGITLDEAKKLLNKQELGKFKDNLDKLIKSSKQDGLTEAEQKELRLLKARTNISKLDDLKTQIKYELEKLTGKNQVTIEDLLRNSYKDTYHKTIYDTEYTSSFNILSKDRVEKAARTKYMSSNYSSRLYEGKQKLLTKVLEQDIPRGLALGYNPRKLAREVEKSLGTNFNACVRLIRTENNRITNEATLDALKQEGEKYYKIDVTLDSRTSDICRLIAAEDDVYEVSKAEIGITAPPFHPNCYDKETEVYTNNGWKLFKDLSEEDLVYTINPETLVPEYEKPKKYISYKYTGEMLRFSHKSFDLCVTPNHNVWLKYLGQGASGKYRFVTADKMPKSKNSIYRSCQWNGIEPETIKLGDYDIPTELYCRFMAYWLADGSISYKTEKHTSNTVNIAQTTYNEQFYNELKELPVNLLRNEDKIYFNDASIYEYLKQFGRCNEKYIPDEIKELSPRLIQLFLDCYTITDGHKTKGKVWSGYQCNDSVQYFTTSKRLADDLGELIMKCGRRPSFKLDKVAGEPCFDGKYKHNYDVWKISDNTTVNAITDSFQRETINYDDYVYCVELEKYHTLLVRRNGQVCWCGNCRSLVVKYIPDDEFTNMTYEQMEEYYANQPSFEDWLKGLEKQANDKMKYKR